MKQNFNPTFKKSNRYLFFLEPESTGTAQPGFWGIGNGGGGFQVISVAILNYLSLKVCLHETAKIGPIFAVRQFLPGCMSHFCKHKTDGHHIEQNRKER
jgi:hypothetical protein